MSAENEKLVTDFCHAWSKLNVDEILGYLAEDCFYHNIPMEPMTGHAAIRAFAEPMLKTPIRPSLIFCTQLRLAMLS